MYKEDDMPTLKKVAPEEVQTWESNGKGTGARREIESAYDGYLADFVPYEWGRADLEDGDVKANVRNRLKAAALRRGLGIEFRRTRDNAVIFQLVTKGQDTDAGDVPF